MEAAAVQKIIDLVQKREIELHSVTYSDRPLAPVLPPKCGTLLFNTLGGLVAYAEKGHDAIPQWPVVCHVMHVGKVALIGPVDDIYRTREIVAEADLIETPFPFGQWLEHEVAMIQFQALFLDTPERASLLKLLSSITADEIRTQADDGTTQVVTAKAGVTLTERVSLPNPVTLAPYRTFREVEQVASPFILRVRKGPNGGPQIALFEADGGTWKLEAIKRVAEWLSGHLPPEIPVLA